MARLPRLYVPGLPAHIRVRGNDGQPIFHSEGDRVFFHRCLVDATKRHEMDVHAYVLMTNHVHLLATGRHEHALARVIQSMGRRYVSYFNYLHERSGTLWEGRYRSCLVDSGRYFMAVHRYVEQNPVRAGMVGDPARHAWSSFRFNALGAADDLVCPHSAYLELGSTEERRRDAYRRLFREELDSSTLAEIRDAVSKGWALGDKAFCDELERLTGRRAVRGKPGRPQREPEGEPDATPVGSRELF